MKNEEAIKHLSFSEIYTDDWEAVLMAKEALEKQIPKKPMYLGSKFQSNGRHILGCYKCSGCDGHIFHMYCPRCGQALDWSDEV